MRDFGAIGFPPERFSKAAMKGIVVPNKEHLDALHPIWQKLSTEERAVLGVSAFERPKTEQGIRDFCLRIHNAYMAQRSREMTAPFVRANWRGRLRTA